MIGLASLSRFNARARALWSTHDSRGRLWTLKIKSRSLDAVCIQARASTRLHNIDSERGGTTTTVDVRSTRRRVVDQMRAPLPLGSIERKGGKLICLFGAQELESLAHSLARSHLEDVVCVRVFVCVSLA